MTGKAKGYFLGAVAAATYGMNPLFALPLYDDGMDSDSVLFFRYLFAIPLLAIMLKARGRSLAIKRCEVAPLLFFGVMIALSSLTLFLSYGYMGASIASTLLFIYPILVALIMAVMFHERLRAATVVCMLSALLGIALLYKNEDGSTISLVGSIIVFFSSLSYAIYLVGVNRVKAIKDEPTLKITLYVLVFGLSVFIIRLLWIGQITMPSHWYMWGNVLGLAVFPTAISFLCNPEHRLHPNRNSRRAGTSHRYILRHHDFRRDNVGTAKRRAGAHNRGCDPGNRRRKPFGAADTLPASLPASAQKKIMLAVSAELRNFTA